VSTGERFERVVLVTGAGAGSGIGAALARRIAGHGVALMLHARGADEAARARLAAVAAECEQRGATCATTGPRLNTGQVIHVDGGLTL
jgi:NADP-dependent 3-hydroxy acid dehydrogenase YdfG